VRQVIEKGSCVADVAKRLGITDKSLYYWASKAKVPANQSVEQTINYKETHRNEPESYVLGLIAIMGVLLISLCFHLIHRD
jgi:transposase-like protein